MKREYYSETIENFLKVSSDEIFSELAQNNNFPLEQTQKDAWLDEISILKSVLSSYHGSIYFEYSIPRMGKRVDVIVLIGPTIFVLEFKVGEDEFHASDMDQVWDYALDLKNFHETSHDHYIAPILIATEAINNLIEVGTTLHDDKLLFPIKCNKVNIGDAITNVLKFTEGDDIDPIRWEMGRYQPTPTIVEAAIALYNHHSVSDISRKDASANNLTVTSDTISNIIYSSKNNSQKSICFVTGVPGSGKTLIGLNIANKHTDKNNDLYSVYLSGNGPLVKILREALARNRVAIEKQNQKKLRKYEAMSAVKEFIQNIHNFRDTCLIDSRPPIEHVALFDEAQRAWDVQQTSKFMKTKKKMPNFNISEPEFLISCLNRHKDWAVIVCLVGGGQEINTGEAGIGEWIESLNRSFPDWHIYISSRLSDSEYATGNLLEKIKNHPNVVVKNELHLSVSMRSFRAENISLLVKQVLDINTNDARNTHENIHKKYPIVLTRDLNKAKQWLKSQARGSERYGLIVSSQAERLKSHGIFVKAPVDPVYWFLNDKHDVRSSYYLEDVVTEFAIQGLELDWACVTWDADFRYLDHRWDNWSFKGDRWQHIRKPEIQNYQKNAYRVLLTRARQGMVIVVPYGDQSDPTRKSEFYDSTYQYLLSIGFKTI